MGCAPSSSAARNPGAEAPNLNPKHESATDPEPIPESILYVPKPIPYVPKPNPFVPPAAAAASNAPAAAAAAVGADPEPIPESIPYVPKAIPYVPKAMPYVPKPIPFVTPAAPAASNAPAAPAAVVGADRFAQLRGASVGCEIDLCEERGITIQQLQHTLATATALCTAEGWTSTAPGCSHVRLEAHTMTLYDVTSQVVIPATTARQCSLVELLATGPQPPTWFVSHWWGEPVLHFLQVLKQHAADRRLGPETVYWVCAYANRQHASELAKELDLAPEHTPFFKALQRSVGTLSIADGRGIVFSRAWCAYELFLTVLQKQSGSEGEEHRHLHDVYTALAPADDTTGRWAVRAVGIVDGAAPVDLDFGQISAPRLKAARERDFPAQLSHLVLESSVRTAEASMPEDLVKIQAAITDAETLDATVRARVGEGVLARLLEGEGGASAAEALLRRYCDAFAKSLLTSLSLTLTEAPAEGPEEDGGTSGGSQDGQALHACERRCAVLAASLPPLLVRLRLLGGRAARMGEALGVVLSSSECSLCKLELTDCLGTDQMVEHLAQGLRTNQSLLELVLDSNRIGDRGAVALASAIGGNAASRLEALSLNFNRIGDAGGEALASALEATHSVKEASLANNQLGDLAAAAFGARLGAYRSLRTLSLRENRVANAGARALATACMSAEAGGPCSVELVQLWDNGAISLEVQQELRTQFKPRMASNQPQQPGASATGSGTAAPPPLLSAAATAPADSGKGAFLAV
jgi:hypothetical protein